jgi:hypothetical protein
MRSVERLKVEKNKCIVSRGDDPKIFIFIGTLFEENA